MTAYAQWCRRYQSPREYLTERSARPRVSPSEHSQAKNDQLLMDGGGAAGGEEGEEKKSISCGDNVNIFPPNDLPWTI